MTIGSRVVIGIRSTIIAHFREVKGVTIGDDVFIGPGVSSCCQAQRLEPDRW